MTRELLPDIVVLDIGMPALNGIEAAKRIRQDSPTSKIIFLTQNNDEDIRLEALATGAEAYLLKANAGSEFLPSVEAALLFV
jgi:DNA-binding NarL/FixJ family response regulator